MLRVGPSELSRILGVSRQSVYRAERNNYIHRGSDRKYDIAQTRKDWLDATPFSIGGIHDRISDDPGHAPQHRALSNLMDIWALSLKSMSLILREIQTFDEKDRHFQTLSLLFLCQWEYLSAYLELGEDEPLTFTGDMHTLSQKRGAAQLEKWLKKQARINFQQD